jgi:hypothetical protein
MDLLESIDIILRNSGIKDIPNWKSNQKEFYLFAKANIPKLGKTTIKNVVATRINLPTKNEILQTMSNTLKQEKQKQQYTEAPD